MHIYVYVQITRKHFALTCKIEATQNNPLCLCFLRVWEGPHQPVHSNYLETEKQKRKRV